MKKEKNNSFIIKLGDFITNFRYVFLVIFVLLASFFVFKIDDVKINNSITSYLPQDTETKNGLDIMDKEFGKLSTIQLMISDINIENANEMYSKLSKLDNIDNVLFNSKDNYKDDKALYTINLVNKDKEEIKDIEKDIKALVGDNEYDLYSEDLVDPTDGVELVLLLVVIIIITILLITSKSYFAPVIAFIIFGISIILNMGTNYLLGEISYITESIAVVLQLALSIDYVIIFINQYMKEINDTKDLTLAIKKTTSKAIPEIIASSLTTISGLLALVFMHLRIGGDIGVVLSKGILFSLLTVILLMPSLLYLFNKIIIKWKKKDKPQKELKISNFIVNKRKWLLGIFVVILTLSITVINKYNYVYNLNSINSVNKSDSTLALKNIEKTFGKENNLVILVKNDKKDYQKEYLVAQKLLNNKKINSVTSIGNFKLNDELSLGTSLNYQEFSKVIGMPEDMTGKLFGLIASKMNYPIEQIKELRVPVIDLINFIHENELSLNLNKELSSKVDFYYNAINQSINLLESKNYSRMVLNLDVPVEGEETKKLLDEIRNITGDYYKDVTLVGNSINSLDLESTFTSDNIKITFITILFIAIILLFTFKSIPIVILLILTIEGSILMNFGIMTIFDQKIFFMTYVVVSAIQMGATIDYAIVLTSRYKQLRSKLDKEEALVGTLNDSLPTITTSGLILLIAGIIVGTVSISPVISSIGIFLSIGTFISLVCTIFVLPAILYLTDKIIIKKN